MSRPSRYPGVKTYRSSNDEWYSYFGGARIFARPGTPEFESELAHLKEQLCPAPGTLGFLIGKLAHNNEFQTEVSRRKLRVRRALRWLKPHYRKSLDCFDLKLLNEIKGRAYDAGGRGFSEQVTATLKLVLSWAVVTKRCG